MEAIIYHSKEQTNLRKRRSNFNQRIAAVEKKFNTPAAKPNVMEQLIALVKQHCTNGKLYFH